MDLFDFLMSQGYISIRYVNGKGYCGIEEMLYDYALFYGMTRIGREGHYCFDTLIEAMKSLGEWNGIGDPPGNWSYHKGLQGRYKNANYKKHS